MNVIFICVVVIFTIYLLVEYVSTYKSIQTMYVPGILTSAENESSVITNSHRNIQDLLIYTIDVLRTHGNVVADPYFYANSVDVILTNHHFYRTVFEFVISLRSRSDIDMNTLLIQLYGHDYEHSPKLNIYVKMQTSNYEVETVKHYLITDIERGFELYEAYKNIIDKYLQ